MTFGSRAQPLPRSAALAREAARLAGGVTEEAAAGASESSEAFSEFRELVASAGAVVVAEVMQHRPKPDPATLAGKGKVEEIAAVAQSTQATLILFDRDLTPTQLRNRKSCCPSGLWTVRG